MPFVKKTSNKQKLLLLSMSLGVASTALAFTVTDGKQYVNQQNVQVGPAASVVKTISPSVGYNYNSSPLTTSVSGEQQYTPMEKSSSNDFQQKASVNSSVRDCTPHPGAAKVGIKHYKFTEAPRDELVEIPSRYRQGGGQNRYIHKDALQSLTQMIDDSHGLLTVGSAFRSVAYQRGLKGGKPNAGAAAWRSSAPAGYSEHHTGFAVDFNPINSSFANTRAYRWLKENAHKYGWYQTFTAEYSRASGVMEEAWHWKYQGSETARNYTINATCLLGR